MLANRTPHLTPTFSRPVSMNFERIATLQNYYQVDGRPMDAILFSRYTKGSGSSFHTRLRIGTDAMCDFSKRRLATDTSNHCFLLMPPDVTVCRLLDHELFLCFD
jgi:hypothetical protein